MEATTCNFKQQVYMFSKNIFCLSQELDSECRFLTKSYDWGLLKVQIIIFSQSWTAPSFLVLFYQDS